MNTKHYIKIFFFLFLLVLVLKNTEAYSYIGLGSGAYVGSVAQGTLVERQANANGLGYESVIFSWAGPLKNGTNGGITVSDFGVSAAGDTYIVTMGPELEDTVVAAKEEQAMEEEQATTTIASSGGGGGGGSSRRDTYGLIVGDILTIIINDEVHTLSVDEIYEGSAVLTVRSVGKTIELNIGETQQLDIIDSYSGEDVALTLVSVSELRKVVITVEDLTQEESTGETVSETEQQQEEQETVPALERITGAVTGINTEQVQKVAKEVKKGVTTATKWIILVNVVFGILAGSMIAAKKVQERRIYKIFHQKPRQELIAEELKKVEIYAKQAMQQGQRYEEIKQNLLHAGWQEYEVDEVVVNAMLAEKQTLNT